MTSGLIRKMKWNLAWNMAHPEDMERRNLAEIFLSGLMEPIINLSNDRLVADFIDAFGDRPAMWAKGVFAKADIAEEFTAEEEYELLTLVREATKRVDEVDDVPMH